MIHYIKPEITVINISAESMIAYSGYKVRPCNELCRYWHICRDREYNKECPDKEYK